MSGPIAFAANGDPVNKPLVLLAVALSGASGGNVIKLVQTSSKVN